jgi:hypothetical protein
MLLNCPPPQHSVPESGIGADPAGPLFARAAKNTPALSGSKTLFFRSS